MRAHSKKYPGLFRRGNVFCVRKRVPDDLRGLIGKTEFIQSLKTSDRKQAEADYLHVLAEINAEIEAANRKQKHKSAVALSPAQAERIAKSWYRREREKAEERAFRIVDGVGRQEYLDELVGWEALYREGHHEDYAAHIQDTVNGLLEAEGYLIRERDEDGLPQRPIDFDTSQASYRALQNYVVRGKLDLIAVERAILTGRQTKDPLFSARPGVREHHNMPSASPVTTIDQLVEKYLNAECSEESSRKRMDLQAAFRVLLEVTGNSLDANKVTYDHFAEVLGLLKKLPPNFTKGKARKNATLKQIASKNEQDGDVALSVTTINKYMARISALFQWGVDTGHVHNNFASSRSLRAKRDRLVGDKHKRETFTIQELNTLFSKQPFTDPDRDSPSLYWVPLIALFHGMRMEEILQLRATDFECADGIHHLRIHGENGNKIKNAHSARTIPLHPELVRLGLLELVTSARKNPGMRLFPDVPRGSEGRYSHVFTRRFSRHLEKVGIKRDKLSFHSFRHNFRDAGRNNSIPTDRVLQLGGWADGTGAQAAYGSGIELKELNKAMKQISYDGLELQKVFRIEW